MSVCYTIFLSLKFVSGNSSIGRASPSQGEGCGSESRFPLHNSYVIYFVLPVIVALYTGTGVFLSEYDKGAVCVQVFTEFMH